MSLQQQQKKSKNVLFSLYIISWDDLFVKISERPLKPGKII